MMTFEQFESLAEEYTAIPVYQTVLSDLLTPVSSYLRLSRNSEYTVLLESVEEGRHLARYSYIGRNPEVLLIHNDGETQIIEDGTTRNTRQEFVDIIREYSNRYQVPKIAEIPTIAGGWIGYHG